MSLSLTPVRRPSKAKTPPVKRAAKPAPPPIPKVEPINITIQIAGLLASVSLVTLASQLALHPLYGATASSLYFKHTVGISCLLSTLRPAMPAHRILLFIAILLAAAPLSAKLLGSWTGRWGDPKWGPVITQSSIAVPVVGLSSVLLRDRLATLRPNLQPVAISAGLLFIGIQVIEPIWQSILPSGGVFTSCNIFLFLSVAASLLSALTVPITGATPQAASRSLTTTAVTISIPLFFAIFSKSNSPCSSPRLPATYSSIYQPPVNASLLTQLGSHLGLNELEYPEPMNYTFDLLARTDSVTGTIVVGEYKTAKNSLPLRFLRADHSILGGLWIGPKKYGSGGGESIYATFVQQELVRLVKRESREGENALIIGLGIGVAADALIKHGHKVHVVEIDPAVYTYARGFFNLSEPYSVDFQDARSWVHKRLNEFKKESPVLDLTAREANKFPIVIHDCFSGGGVPEHIFTLEFFDELKGIMTDDGAVAVNFVGHIGSDSAKAIWFTLQEAFSPKNGGRGCRAFHDLIPDGRGAHDPNATDVINMVYFCQKNGHIGVGGDGQKEAVKKVQFRAGVAEDYLESFLRYRVFSTMGIRELTEAQITGIDEGERLNPNDWVLTDRRNNLGELQSALAIEHWSLMRDVLPPPIWEIY